MSKEVKTGDDYMNILSGTNKFYKLVKVKVGLIKLVENKNTYWYLKTNDTDNRIFKFKKLEKFEPSSSLND